MKKVLIFFFFILNLSLIKADIFTAYNITLSVNDIMIDKICVSRIDMIIKDIDEDAIEGEVIN